MAVGIMMYTEAHLRMVPGVISLLVVSYVVFRWILGKPPQNSSKP